MEKRFFLVEEVDSDNSSNTSVIQATSDKKLNVKLTKALTDMLCLGANDEITNVDTLSISENFKYGGSVIINVEYNTDGEAEIRQIRVSETCLY